MGASKNVLVVGDDKDILQLIKMYLDKEGFRTVTAVNGAEALKQVKSEHPDLIVLDLMLPEIDGLEVCSVGVPSMVWGPQHGPRDTYRPPRSTKNRKPRCGFQPYQSSYALP